MLNPFPTLLSFSFFAPFLLRVVVGLITATAGFKMFSGKLETHAALLKVSGLPPRKTWIHLMALVQIVGGGMLILGYLTQIAALVIGVGALFAMLLTYTHPHKLQHSASFFGLVAIICFSLLLLGAGAFAYDLPL